MEERNINPRLTILCDAGSGGAKEYADISGLCGMRSAKKRQRGRCVFGFCHSIDSFCFLVYDLSLPISLFVRIIIQNVVARSVSNVVDFILYQNMPNVKQFRKNLTIYLQVPQFYALSDNI